MERSDRDAFTWMGDDDGMPRGIPILGVAAPLGNKLESVAAKDVQKSI